MATANFNMRFDAETKKEFESVLAEYGLTVPQAFKLFANQVIKTRTVPLSFDFAGSQEKTKMTEAEFYQMIDERLQTPHSDCRMLDENYQKELLGL